MIPHDCIQKWPSILWKEEKKDSCSNWADFSDENAESSWNSVMWGISQCVDTAMLLSPVQYINPIWSWLQIWYRRCCNVLRSVATFSVLEILFQWRDDGYKRWWFDVIHFLVKSLSYLQKIQIYKVCIEFTLIEVVHSYFPGRSRRN